jgi:hypothetical protein
MTRRAFGACLSRAFFGMVAFVTMLKREWVNPAEKTEASGGRTHHIRNRRLFNFAAGTAALADKERAHLHECNVCQEMAYVLMRQSVPFLS